MNFKRHLSNVCVSNIFGPKRLPLFLLGIILKEFVLDPKNTAQSGLKLNFAPNYSFQILSVSIKPISCFLHINFIVTYTAFALYCCRKTPNLQQNLLTLSWEKFLLNIFPELWIFNFKEKKLFDHGTKQFD